MFVRPCSKVVALACLTENNCHGCPQQAEEHYGVHGFFLKESLTHSTADCRYSLLPMLANVFQCP